MINSIDQQSDLLACVQANKHIRKEIILWLLEIDGKFDDYHNDFSYYSNSIINLIWQNVEIKSICSLRVVRFAYVFIISQSRPRNF